MSRNRGVYRWGLPERWTMWKRLFCANNRDARRYIQRISTWINDKRRPR